MKHSPSLAGSRWSTLSTQSAQRGRRGRKRREDPPIPDRWPIHARPTKAHIRAEIGHWAADLMHFRGQKACLLTCQDFATEEKTVEFLTPGH